MKRRVRVEQWEQLVYACMNSYIAALAKLLRYYSRKNILRVTTELTNSEPSVRSAGLSNSSRRPL